MKKMILSHLQNILRYNHWANTRLIENLSKIADEDYLKPLPIPFTNLHGLLSHLHEYDRKQYQELKSKDASTQEESLSRPALADDILFYVYAKKWLLWIEAVIQQDPSPEFLERISKNIVDLSIHNNYHRGQANIIAHFLGYAPESLDIYAYQASS